MCAELNVLTGLREYLTGRKSVRLCEISLFSVFPDIIVHGNTKKFCSIPHNFHINTKFAFHVTRFYDSKSGNWGVIKYQL